MAQTSLANFFIRNFSTLRRASGLRNSLGRSFSESEKKPQEEEKEPQEKPQESSSDSEDEAKLKELQDKLKATEEEALKYKDHYLRALAEQENTRRRLNKEIENEKTYAITRFAKEIIEVSDNLQRALDNIPSEEKIQEEPFKVLEDMKEGVKMTREVLMGTLMKFEITEYNPVNEKFDPNLHEALFTYQDESKEPGTVGQVISTGYNIKDRILRSAKVGVIKKA